jgi:glycosyltransferase involved in cell wall biosynthesis
MTIDSLSWTFVPQLINESVRQVSQTGEDRLVEVIRDWQPSIVILRGIGTRLSAQIARQYRPIVIVGGRYLAPDVAYARAIYVENEKQRRIIKFLTFRTEVKVLQKLVDPAFSLRRTEGPIAFDIAVVSAFVPWKNHYALKGLCSRPVSIAFIGDGPLRMEIEELFASVAAKAQFFGNISSNSVAEVLKSSRILVHPSLSEGIPRAVVESLVCGVPVVACSGVVGLPVEHMKNGLLVEPEILSLEVLKLLSNEELLSQLSDGAKQTSGLLSNPRMLDDLISDIEITLEKPTYVPCRFRTALSSGLVAISAKTQRVSRKIRAIRGSVSNRP